MKKHLSPHDASVLALLIQVPEKALKRAEEARQRLLDRLSSEEAREIGRAVLAEEKDKASFSRRAWETAEELRKWKKAGASMQRGVPSRAR